MLKQTYQNKKIKVLIMEIHKSPIKLNIILTGAGFSFLNWLFLCEGASNTVIKATIPYNKNTLFKLIGNLNKNNSLVSKTVSSKLATFAKEEIKDFKNDPQFWGISCTGSISTNYKKRGNHHAWISVNGGPIKKRTWSMHIKLEKGLRNRMEEDQIISYAMIKFLLATSNSKFEIKNIDYSEIFKIKLSTEEKIEISKS